MIVNRQTFNKILVLHRIETGMVFQQKLVQSGAGNCLFQRKSCVIFPIKTLHILRIFAHFLPIRGCFFDNFALLGGKQNVYCALAI